MTAGRPAGSDGEAFGRRLSGIVDAEEKPVIKFVVPRPWETSPEAYGPLLKLVDVPALVGRDAGVVILSLGLRDLAGVKEPALFERYVAALSDIVAVSLEQPVIWVTPPPYPGQADPARAFAAAIRRVADARRIPVADLYTTFCGMRAEMSPFAGGRDVALSEAGQAMAAQVIARVLLQE